MKPSGFEDIPFIIIYRLKLLFILLLLLLNLLLLLLNLLSSDNKSINLI